MPERVVMVTGASAGVGRAAACAFARGGAAVGLLARGAAGLEAARRDVEGLGGRAAVFQADVADAAQVDEAANRLVAEFGRIDVWVNNAMASVFSPVAEMTPDDYRRVTEVTYLGVVHGSLAALRHMRPRNRGCIVQVGSTLAYRGIPLQSAYCAAKHAVQGFCDSLRAELLHDESAIRVVMVQMPALNTPQFEWVKSRLPHRPRPVPPIFQPEVAATAILWASESDRREVYVGLPTVAGVVGNKVAPRLADWYLGRTGHDAQQTSEPENPGRRHNLWEPVDHTRDFGAHGRFDADARDSSTQLWATQHRAALLGAAAAAGALIVAAASQRRRGRPSARAWLEPLRGGH